MGTKFTYTCGEKTELMEPLHEPLDMTLVNKITSFINSVGIECRAGKIDRPTFLPGIDIVAGSIIYDLTQLKYPGDLLHDAGHLAVLLPDDRERAKSEDGLCGDIGVGAAEMSAIAWSWAARQYLGLAPEIVFHEHGYRGTSKRMIENFSEGQYVAVPMLQYLRMTKEPKKGVAADEHTYPKMIHWTRQAN